jgi:hypothetical protein
MRYLICILLCLVFGDLFAREVVDHRSLKVGVSYRVESMTRLMPNMEKEDEMAVFSKVKDIPEGGAFKVDAVESKYSGTWYKVRAITRDKKVIGAGYINSKELAKQHLTRYGILGTVKATEAVAVVAPASPEDKGPYRIFSTMSLNYVHPGTGTKAKRRILRIQLASNMTKAELKAVAEEMVEKSYGIDALMMYFYKPATDVKGPFTAGMALWSPNGKWDDAVKKAAKKFVFVYGAAEDRFDAKKVADIPVEEKRAAYTALVRAIEIDDKDAAQARAAMALKLGFTILQLRNIHDEGLYKGWPMR